MTDTLAKKDLISIRDYQPSDRNFIFSNWILGYFHGNPWFKDVDRLAFQNFYYSFLDALIKRPSIMIKLACLKDDPDVLLGFSVIEGNDLHFVFCKPDWRRIGIATDLIPKNIEAVTHVTKLGRSILEKYPFITIKSFLI